MVKSNLLLSVLFTAFLLAGFGCGRPGDKGAQVSLSGLPKSVRYPFALSVSRADTTINGVQATGYIFTTTDPIPPVVSYYKTTFAKWKDYPVQPVPGCSLFGLTSPDGRTTLVFNVTPTPDAKTQLAIYSLSGQH
jgi:hypothetical protein